MPFEQSLCGVHVCVCVCVCVVGKPVKVVNGAYRGLRAVLEGLNTARFCVSVRIDQVTTSKNPLSVNTESTTASYAVVYILWYRSELWCIMYTLVLV